MSQPLLSFRNFLLWVASFWILAQAPGALAYFDPASGSLVLQMIIGGIAGVAFIVKLYWHKLLGLFGIKSSPVEEDEGEEIGTGDDDER